MGKLGRLGAQMMTEAKAIIPNAKTVRQGQILPTENTTWGYFGTIGHAVKSETDATSIWNETFKAIMSAFPNVSSQAIREFLDSTYGRHYGDAILDELIDKMGKAFDPDSEAPISVPAPAALKGILKASLAKLKWVEQELLRNAPGGGAPNGTVQDVAGALKKVEAAWAEAQTQEKRKNWKERDAAMHVLQSEADRLATAARAWLAQRR
jgi:hypothetical protein